MDVAGANTSVMQLDRPARDREAEAHAPASPIAIALNAIEGVEDARQGFVRNARAVVPDLYRCVPVTTAEPHLEIRSLRRIANSVPDNVFESAPE